MLSHLHGFPWGLEQWGLEEVDASLPAETARRIQKPPTGHLEGVRLANRMLSVFEGFGSAGKICVRSRYSLRPSKIDPVLV